MPIICRVVTSIFSSARKNALLVLLFVFSFSFIGLPAHAQLTGAVQNAQLTAQAAGVTSGGDLVTIIGRLINILLGFLGVVFLVLMLYAGFIWMTAGGDEKKVEKARAYIRNSIIGLVIIASSWAIVSFILNALVGATGNLGGGGGGQGAGGFGSLGGASGALGAGIIESHLPMRNATNVPRNTPIIITFKQPIRPDSFISGWTEATSNTATGLNSQAIQIYRTETGATGALTTDKVRVRYTKDLKTYVLKPVDYLGSATQNVGYTVTLKGGKSGITLADGTSAFSGSFGGGYIWQFEVSTVLDLKPPHIVSEVPQPGGQYARNIVASVTFDEAIDPTAASGNTADGFMNIQAVSGSPGAQNLAPLTGEFRISNGYRTVEFLPDTSCGTNSCNKTVFCLPGSQTVEIHVKAATLDPNAIPQAQLTSNGYDGVVDVAGNSLDGNHDGTAQGSPTDNAQWSFGTDASVKLTPPKVEMTTPSSDPQSGNNSNVPLDQPVMAQFDSLLQSSSLNTDTVKIDAHGKDETNPDTFWWTIGMRLLTANGAEVDPTKTPPDIAAKAAVVVTHRPFLPSGSGIQNLNYYDPYLLSGIQDAYQNCFNPAATCGTGAGSPNCCNNNPNTDPAGCKKTLHP